MLEEYQEDQCAESRQSGKQEREVMRAQMQDLLPIMRTSLSFD